MILVPMPIHSLKVSFEMLSWIHWPMPFLNGGFGSLWPIWPVFEQRKSPPEVGLSVLSLFWTTSGMGALISLSMLSMASLGSMSPRVTDSM